MYTYLNVAAGNILPENVHRLPHPYALINLDLSYYNGNTPEEVEKDILSIPAVSKTYYCNADIFQFLERTVLMFDKIYIYRFLEHVSFTQILYFIYLLSRVIEKEKTIEVIVPNYKILASMLKSETIEDVKNEAHNIILTTELLNEPSCPHASIWTPDRVIYYWQLEKRFEITQLNNVYEFDGRGIYLKFIAKRI